MPLTENGVALLRQVQLIIAARPGQFHMETPCGTVCCIAGWVDHLTGGTARTECDVRTAGAPPIWWEIAGRAATALGMSYPSAPEPWNPNMLDDGPICDLDELFMVDCWPSRLREQYEDLPFEAISDDERIAKSARLACERIDQFIDEYGPLATAEGRSQ